MSRLAVSPEHQRRKYYVTRKRKKLPPLTLGALGLFATMVVNTVGASCLAEEPAKAVPPITALAIAPDGQHLLAGSQAGVEVLRLADLKKVESLAVEMEAVHHLAFSSDGKKLLVAGGAAGEWGGIEIWSWPEKKRLGAARPHEDLIYKASWSAEGNRIVTASGDGTAKVLDGETLEVKQTYGGHSRAVLAAIWLGEDQKAITAGVDQTIQLWNGGDGKAIRSLTNHVGTVSAAALRHGGDGPPILASIGEDKTLRLWQPTIGRLVRFTKLPSPPRAVQWDASGERLLVGCNDGVVRALDFETLTIQRELAGDVGRIHELVLHPKGDALIVGGERGIKLISLGGEKQR